MKLKKDWNPVRYSVIDNKCQREIVMLRGRGCFWQKCRFCDYHLDKSPNLEENFVINKKALDQVQGIYSRLEVINSGSFPELDQNTIDYILKVCHEKKINTIYIESHYRYKDQLPLIKKLFAPIKVNIKLGVETFDIDFREKVMNKGIGNLTAEMIAKDFEDCCLLIGLKGQTREMISNDIILAEKYFNRICINAFIPNESVMEEDQELIRWFIDYWYPKLVNDDRFDVLLDNNAFGVGGICTR